jgi:hypothetical protein
MKLAFSVAALFVLALACGQTPSEDPPVDTSESNSPTEAVAEATEAPASPTTVPPTETTAPATATSVPPTATEVPPTATATEIPDPIVVSDETAADGCQLVELNPGTWSPLYNAYNGGSDPFFHIHSQEGPGTFFFSLEFYTIYGSGWTGQTGDFEPNCDTHGICIYLVPDAVNPYIATAGSVEVVALSQTDGALDFPVEVHLSDMTFMPTPGSGSPGCVHVEAVSFLIEE